MSDGIIVSAGSSVNIPTHPDGQFAATCIDVIDRGIVESTYSGETKKVHKVTLRFWCGETFEGEDGGPQPLWLDEWFTASLHEKANLRKFLEGWRGRKFTDDELRGFDLETLLEVPAYVQISHNPTPQKVYANIDSIMRLKDTSDAPGVPAGYVRVVDREDEEEEDGFNEPAPAPAGGIEEEEDDLPF